MSGTVARRVAFTVGGWILFVAVAFATLESVSDRALRITAGVLLLAAGLTISAAVLVAAFARHERTPVPASSPGRRDDRLGRALHRPPGLGSAQRVRVVVDDARCVKSFEPRGVHHSAMKVAHGAD